MNLDTRARDAAESLRTATPVDAEDGLRRLHSSHQRRTTGKVIAAVAAVAVGVVGVVQIQRDRDNALPPVSPSSHWVLVTGNGVGGADNPVQPVGGEWAEPLAERGVQSYPSFRSADPATQRFLVINADATAYHVMTPGRRDPLVTVQCGSGGCLGATLGPGPDEVTMTTHPFAVRPGSPAFRLEVVGPDGQTRRELEAVEVPAGHVVWSPDGTTWAETRSDHGRDMGSLTVVLRHPDSAERTTLYEYSEAAPPWYDAEEHRFGNGPGAFNDWVRRACSSCTGHPAPHGWPSPRWPRPRARRAAATFSGSCS